MKYASFEELTDDCMTFRASTIICEFTSSVAFRLMPVLRVLLVPGSLKVVLWGSCWLMAADVAITLAADVVAAEVSEDSEGEVGSEEIWDCS